MSLAWWFLTSACETLSWKSDSHNAVLASDYCFRQRMSEEEQVTENVGGLDEMDLLFNTGLKTWIKVQRYKCLGNSK